MNYFEQVGSNIQIVLHKKNMKKTDLAKKLNISRQMVQKIINGQKAINVKEISSIAEALSVAIDDLLQESSQQVQIVASVQFMGNPTEARDFSFIERTIREYMKLEDRLAASMDEGGSPL
jgi:DNA-binding Xre family transcriptional regulator